MKKLIFFKVFIFIIFIFIAGIKQDAFAQNKRVVLQLRWSPQFQFAGYYVAEWNGYYKDEGLDVDIKSAFTSDKKILYAPREVEEGRADFGIGAVDVLMAENAGADLSIVASLFQRSAVEFYMKADTPFHSIIDLTKLNTARRKNDLLDIELQAMLISEGIKPDNRKMLSDTYDFTADDLAKNRFDVIPGYLGTISYLAKKQGLAIKEIKPIDYGIDFYGDSLFTRRSLAIKDPNLVERFRKASLRGWEYALEHPDEVSKRIAREFKIDGKSEKELEQYNRFQAGRVIALTLYPVVEIGNINPYRWMKMQEILLKLGLVNGKPDFNNFIFDYNKILDAKNKRMERIFTGTMLALFTIFIIFFIIRLAAKNTMLRKENIERKKAEEKIGRSTQRYQAMFNSAVLGITITSTDGDILQANRRWLDMTGYEEGDVIGRNITDLVVQGDPDILELKERFTNEEIESYEMEQQYIRKDGNLVWGRLFMTSIFDQDSDNKVNMGMVLDITNEKVEEEAVNRSERRFRKIINEIASGIPEIEMNEGFQKLDSEENHELPTDKSELSSKLEKINIELERMFKNEMDENKKKEALLIYQARLAAMGEMIGNIAHQWRQPLNNLGLIISNLEDAAIYNELEVGFINTAVEKCRKLIARMSDTIDDFRYFLNPRNEKTSFSVSENLNMVLEMLEENLRFNKIKISQDIRTEEVAFGYANQYSQAIFNIINNSIDALAEQNIAQKEIRICIYKEGRMVSVEISDNGSGIKEEFVDKIFDVYFSTKYDKKGTGLGLYMTKLIIENNMGGRIKLLEYKKGVTMKVSIPANGGSEYDRKCEQ